MTQDGYTDGEGAPFAAAEQVSATLGTLAEALLDHRTTRYSAQSLTALRGRVHPVAEALFDVRLGERGAAHQAVDRLGTVIAARTARVGDPAHTGGPVRTGAVSTAAATALLARFGGGTVRGATPGAEGPTAALFELPVSGEVADPKLRPPFAAALAALANGQQTRRSATLAAGSGAEVRLVVPSVFHPLTTPDAGADLAEHLAEVAEEVFSGAGPAERRDFAVIGASLADLISASGVAFAGLSALTVDGRSSDASLVVSLARHQSPIQALANELATARPHAEVWTVLLPAGPAAVLVEGRTVPVPGALAADGQRRWAVTSVVQAFVPLPDGASVLCVQLATAQAQDWDLYAAVVAEMLKSVQFAWDGVDARTPAPIPAQAVAAPPIAVPPVQAPPVQAPPAPAPAPPATQAPPVAPPAAPAPVVAPPVEAEAPKGTPVRIPPPDFNPFAPQPAQVQTQAPADDEAPKGTPVRIPPPDFNPFAPRPDSAPAAPAPAAAPAAPAAQATDPFGTVTVDQPSDPFGTKLPSATLTPAAPAPAAAPPRPSAPPAAPADGRPVTRTPVRIPPPDFNPFAPRPDAPAEAPPAAPAAPEAPAAPPASPFG